MLNFHDYLQNGRGHPMMVCASLSSVRWTVWRYSNQPDVHALTRPESQEDGGEYAVWTRPKGGNSGERNKAQHP